MLVIDHKLNILKKIEEREVFRWNSNLTQERNHEEQTRKIIDIAAEVLHILLDEPLRKNFGELKDDAWAKGLEEIVVIVSEILEDQLIPVPVATLRAKIGLEESGMPKYDE